MKCCHLSGQWDEIQGPFPGGDALWASRAVIAHVSVMICRKVIKQCWVFCGNQLRFCSTCRWQWFKTHLVASILPAQWNWLSAHNKLHGLHLYLVTNCDSCTPVVVLHYYFLLLKTVCVAHCPLFCPLPGFLCPRAEAVSLCCSSWSCASACT